MNWPAFSIKHKYTIFALVLAVIIFGLYAKENMKEELFPETAPPLVNVITAYPGASPADVAKNLSQPLEEEFTTIDGAKTIKSSSQNGLSIVKIEFHYGKDVDEAAVDVQNAIARIRKDLPTGIAEPQVMKFSSSNRPVLTLGLSGKGKELTEIRRLADNEIKDRLQLTQGVAAVDVIGGHKRQVNVLLDRSRLASFNIPLEKVVGAIKNTNITDPGGNLIQSEKEYTVRFTQETGDPAALGDLIIDNRGGKPVYLRDVATIQDGTVENRSAYRLKGEHSIAIQILKKDDANTVEVIDRVKDKLEEMKKDYPDVTFAVAEDDSIFTKQVVDNMSETTRDALILTALIVLLFLVTINESIVVALSMPLSLLCTLGMMLAAGMSLNLITLSALILSVGIVVDDAIVVVENIMRHCHDLGKDIKSAAIDGTNEIMLANVAGTSTIIIVLIPLLFVTGFVGRVFGPMAMTLIFAMISSLLVSLTIIPLLTFLLGGKRWERGERVVAMVISPFTRVVDKLRDFYVRILGIAMKARFITVLVAAGIFILSLRLLGIVGMEVLPKMDAGTFFISIQTFPGTSLEKTSEVVGHVEELLNKEKNVTSYSTQIGYEPGGHYLGDNGAMGVSQAFVSVTLNSRKERQETIWQIEDRLRAEIEKIPDIETFVIKETGGTAKSTTVAPIDIKISGEDSEILNHLAEQVMEKVKGIPGAVNLYKSWSLNTPEINVVVHEERATRLGLYPANVAQEVFAGLEGMKASELQVVYAKNSDIKVRYREQDRQSLGDLLSVNITSPMGISIPLRAVATVETSKGPNVVTGENLQRTINIYGYTLDRPFSHVIKDIQKELDGMEIPEGYSVQIVGENADLKESAGDLGKSLVMAVIGVYLLLVAQFRSFLHPVTIMFTIPMVFIGVALALMLTGKSVSMSAFLGVILLVGTVVRNGIVLIDYIRKARETGMDRGTAITESVKIRFRPIMMTAMSNVAGMFPLAAEWALGSERFSPLATTVIGGILTGTLLTLVLIPVIYSLFDDAFNLFLNP
ncbi:heavy metal efflux pump, CzcA family [Desulforamulus putei DSM 12395]|uniref:Heavy metal efflux pump, CzcA family n=1 Tax=Desulforamulus putei DSM 12395 TaxID=1121429 RepID=A0A1M5CEP5_9FIRM|nr:efflux RND transporter permease subunit [Desulforamulus putei]SHF53146.1 heavy metal efflux pump, CzcA family [Desulforamulus putei DSM 12395]